MSRVMLVCPEPLGSGQPAGIGIRFLEMAKVLVAAGQQVTVLSPDGGGVPACASPALSPAALRDASGSADVAVVQGHVANDLFAHARPLPTVVDLYDPYVIENLHYFRERGAEVFAHDQTTLLNSLLHGDFFLCASEAQRLFYLGALLATGRVNPAAFETDPRLDALVAIAPFGVQEPRPAAQRNLDRPAVLFGGIYDWYDPIAAIDAVAAARTSVTGLTLTFTRHPNPAITPQGKLAEAMRYVAERGYEFVEFAPWVAYEMRGAFFDRHSLALMTFPQSIETDLAMRTRVYDYLWGGLPVVTSSAPGTDEILERYGAGAVVRDGSFAATLVALLGDRARYDAMSSGAAAFAREHQWSQTLAPLVAFCREPRFDPSKEQFAVTLHPRPQQRSLVDRIRRRMGGRP